MYTIITNNPLISDTYRGFSKDISIDYLPQKGCIQVLERVRDKIHQGNRLETHPMAGSVKPNQNPYKTVLISDMRSDEDEFKEFVIIIENSIDSAKKFLTAKPLPQWPEHILKDFMAVDHSLIKTAIEGI